MPKQEIEYEKAEQYNYKISLLYTSNIAEAVEIDSQQIQYILIDKNFDACNMPVISVFGSIEKSLLDDMLENMSNATMTLTVYKYDVANNNGGIGELYFQDKFMFMMDQDLNKTHNLDDDDYTAGGDTQYKEVNIWLLPQMAVNNNRFIQNGVFHNATMNSMILNATNNVGDMVVEPISYDNSFDQIMIPPTNTISQYMKYLNDNVNTFYDTPYRYFMDFDLTYMVSSAGKPVPAKNQTVNTVTIDVQDIDNENTNDELGAFTDEKASTYKIYTDTSRIDYTSNHLTNRSMNQLTVVDAQGNKTERGINGMTTEITGNFNQVLNISNNDPNLANSIANAATADNTVFSMVKNDLDARLFTINKEYILNDPLHEENATRMLLAQSKQLFIKQGDAFIMSTSLSFRKVST